MQKNTIILLAFFLLFMKSTYAQRSKDIKNSQVKGIYLTHDKFKNNKLSCSLDKQQKDVKIKLKQFFISPEISCVNFDNETVFYKDSIFAIQLSNGENYRFVKHLPYFISDTSFLYIYTYKTVKTEYKQNGPTRRAKEIPVTYYYFSSGEHRDIYNLNLDNLCKYLNFKPDIQVAISKKFINEEMLYSINQKTGHFVLNEFLNELINKKY